MKESGSKTTCMEKEFIHGQTVGSMMETTLMIKNMAMESIDGLMADNMLAFGRKASSMVKEHIPFRVEWSDKAYGMRVNV